MVYKLGGVCVYIAFFEQEHRQYTVVVKTEPLQSIVHIYLQICNTKLCLLTTCMAWCFIGCHTLL